MAKRIQPKGINLLACLKTRPELSRERKRGLAIVSVPLAFVLLASVFFGYFGLASHQLNTETGLSLAYTGDAAHKAVYQKLLAERERTGYYNDALREARDAGLIADSFRQPDKALFEQLQMVSTGLCVLIGYGYERDSGTFTIIGANPDYHTLPDFVRAVKALDWFGRVDYNGYQRKDEVYEFTLTCTMKAVEQ